MGSRLRSGRRCSHGHALASILGSAAPPAASTVRPLRCRWLWRIFALHPNDQTRTASKHRLAWRSSVRHYSSNSFLIAVKAGESRSIWTAAMAALSTGFDECWAGATWAFVRVPCGSRSSKAERIAFGLNAARHCEPRTLAGLSLCGF